MDRDHLGWLGGPAEMPVAVRAARLIMALQAVVAVMIALLWAALIGPFMSVAGPGGPAGILTLMAPVPLVALALGVLTFRLRSGRPWVRLAAVAVQCLLVLAGLLSVVQGGAVTATSVLLVGGGLAVIVPLLRSSAAQWFTAPPGSTAGDSGTGKGPG